MLSNRPTLYLLLVVSLFASLLPGAAEPPDRQRKPQPSPAAKQPAPEATGWIVGTVRDGSNLEPLSDISVSAEGNAGYYDNTRTAENGSYRLALETGQSYTLSTQSQYGYYINRGNFVSGIVPTAGMTTTVNFTLTLIGARMQGQVTDAETGLPLRDVSVRAVRPNGGYPDATNTNSSGNYRFLVAAGQTYTMTALKDLYRTAEVGGISPISNTTTTVNLAMTYAGGAVQGQVTDTGGEPLTYTQVTINGPGGRQQLTTDATGVYSFTTLAGNYSLSADHYLHTQITTTVEVLTRSLVSRDLQLSLAPTHTITGTITSPWGSVGAASVGVLNSPYTAIADAQGRYTATVAVGQRTLTFATPSFCLQQLSLPLAVSSSQLININLPFAGTEYGYRCDDRTYYPYVSGTSVITNWLPNDNPNDPLKDEGYARVTLPFTFSIGNATRAAGQNLIVSTNGNMNFIRDPALQGFFVTHLDRTGVTNEGIFPFWTDLDMSERGGGGGDVYTNVVGTAPNRRLVVEWLDASLFFAPGSRVTFSIELEESSNKVYVHYGAILINSAADQVAVSIGMYSSSILDLLQYFYVERPEGARTANNLSGRSVVYSPPPTPCALRFGDVSNQHLFQRDIYYLACRGIVNGYLDGTFKPSDHTTRGQFAKIATLAFNLAPYTPPTPTFRDVPANHPFYTQIEAAAHAGVISGFADGSFRPADNVTRGQVAKIIQRAGGYAELTPSQPTFSDVAAGSVFYREIETVQQRGIISGAACAGGQGRCYRANDPVRRDELSKIVRKAVLTAP